MTNFTSTLDFKTNIETLVQEGFENALVVKVDEHWSHDDLNGTWGTICKDVVADEDVKIAYDILSTGTMGAKAGCVDTEWTLHTSYYWLVKRSDGRLYPFPLLFASQEERAASSRKYNGYKWNAFYEGRIDSTQLEKGLVDTPTEDEISTLLRLIEQSLDMDSQWDDLDQRGGLVPRWAA